MVENKAIGVVETTDIDDDGSTRYIMYDEETGNCYMTEEQCRKTYGVSLSDMKRYILENSMHVSMHRGYIKNKRSIIKNTFDMLLI